jgi:hypothetical protein
MNATLKDITASKQLQTTPNYTFSFLVGGYEIGEK